MNPEPKGLYLLPDPGRLVRKLEGEGWRIVELPQPLAYRAALVAALAEALAPPGCSCCATGRASPPPIPPASCASSSWCWTPAASGVRATATCGSACRTRCPSPRGRGAFSRRCQPLECAHAAR